MTESSRTPIYLPTYSLGDEGKPNNFDVSIARETAAIEARSLEVGDAAFILRSDHKWAYSILIEKVKGKEGVDSYELSFELDKEKNRKCFREAVWGKYIRVIKVDEGEPAKMEAKDATEKREDEAPKEEEKPEEVKEEEPKEEVIEEELKKKEAKNEESVDATEKKGEKTVYGGESISGAISLFSDFFDSVSKKVDAMKVKDVVKTEKSKPDASAAKDEDKHSASSPASERKTKLTVAPAGEASWLSSWSLFEKKTEKSKKTEKAKPAKTKERAEKTKSAGATETKDEEREPASESATVEGSSTTTPAPIKMAAAARPVISKIKLLSTPIAFYKAVTMQEDPAEAALAATSFADDAEHEYSSLTRDGVVVVDNDPSAAALAETLEKERLYGPLESQGIIIIETNCSVETTSE